MGISHQVFEDRWIRTPGALTITLDDSKGQEALAVEIPGRCKPVLSNGGSSFSVKDDLGNSFK